MKNIFIFLILVIFTHEVKSENQDLHRLIINEYNLYLEQSKSYIDLLKESSGHIRNWRKKRLFELFDERLTELEKNLILSNSSLIGEFENFISKNGVEALDDTLLLRISQLHFEKSNIEYNKKIKQFQLDIDLFAENKISSEPVQPKPDYSEVLKYIEIFLKNFKFSQLVDKAYYLKGFCLQEIGNLDKASVAYSQLLNVSPNSQFREEVTWRLAEINLQQKNYIEAIKLYRNLSRIKNDYYFQSLYKIATTFFTIQNYEQSKRVFERILKEFSSQDSNESNRDILLQESLEYLATIFSKNQTIKISEKYFPDVLYILGQMYLKRLDETSMLEIYKYATEKFPLNHRMPEMYASIINYYENEDDLERSNYYRGLMIDALTKDQQWWVRNDEYRTSIFGAHDILEFNLLKNAEYYARIGYSKNVPDLLKSARQRYFDFITKYPWSPFAERAKLELADLDYFMEKYDSASQLYFELVAEAKSASIREEAAYSLILSEAKKVRFDLKFDAKNFNPNTISKKEFSQQETVFLQAALYYISNIKYSSRKNRILYKVAEMYLEHGDFNSSANYLNLILSDSINTNFITIRSLRLLQEIYNIRGEYKSLSVVQELGRSFNFYVDTGVLDKNDLFQRNLEKIDSALDLEFNGQFLLAAQEYEKVLNQSRIDDFNELLIAKIANFYLKSGDTIKSQNFIDRLKKTKYQKEANFLEAQLFFKKIDFEKSSQLYEKFITENPNHIWYEEAFLNLISIRSQLKQPEKIATFFSKNKPPETAIYLYYEYWDALMKSKKYKDIAESLNKIKKINNFDFYRVHGYLLKAYSGNSDFVNFGTSCESIKKITSGLKAKTAFVSYSLSLCDYFEYRKIISQENTVLEDVIVKLNLIYSHKIDTVTLMALNDLMSLSDIKNNRRSEVKQLIEKGWLVARQSPISNETTQYLKNAISYFNFFPINISYLMNWNVVLADFFEYKSFQDSAGLFRQAQSFCNAKNFIQCFNTLAAISEKETIKEVYENMIFASLKLADDKRLVSTLKQYLQRSNFSDESKAYSILLGYANLIPEGKKSLNKDERNILLLNADAILDVENEKYDEAENKLSSIIQTSPHSPLAYFNLAQLYFRNNKPELARTVIVNGFEASQSRSLSSLLFQLNAVTYSNVSISRQDISLDASPSELFSLAFAAVKNGNSKVLDIIYKRVKESKNWFDMIKSMELVYSNPEKFRSDISDSNNYVIWLSKVFILSKTQSVAEFENLKRLSTYGIRNPALEEIEKIMIVRDIAGEDK